MNKYPPLSRDWDFTVFVDAYLISDICDANAVNAVESAERAVKAGIVFA